MTTTSAITPSQRATNAVAFDQTASTMFAMDAMLTRWPSQLRMPRPDAYIRWTSELLEPGRRVQFADLKAMRKALTSLLRQAASEAGAAKGACPIIHALAAD